MSIQPFDCTQSYSTDVVLIVAVSCQDNAVDGFEGIVQVKLSSSLLSFHKLLSYHYLFIDIAVDFCYVLLSVCILIFMFVIFVTYCYLFVFLYLCFLFLLQINICLYSYIYVFYFFTCYLFVFLYLCFCFVMCCY